MSATPAVRRLVDVTGWSGSSSVDTDWSAVHARLGFELPADYRELLAVFPPGSFRSPGKASDIVLHPPYLVDGVPDHLYQFEVEIDEISQWRHDHPDDVPSEPLVPWARSGKLGLFWVSSSPDPDQWAVAVSNGGIWRFDDEPVVEVFACGVAEFLIGVVTGSLTSRVLDPMNEGFSGQAPVFRPEEETRWRNQYEVHTPRIRRIRSSCGNTSWSMADRCRPVVF